MKGALVDVDDINALANDTRSDGSKNIAFDSLKVRDELKIDRLYMDEIAVEATPQR